VKGLSVEYPMYFGAKPSVFKLAKELRKNETEAEKMLWSKLNKNQIIGLQFRRQHPINIFIADFYCPKIKLVIEVDGSIHEIFEYEKHDIGRSEMLNDFGITVIRFTNEQILNDLDGTIKQIENEVRKLLIETRQHLNE
jgi:very-short-patch-repair endonuclease